MTVLISAGLSGASHAQEVVGRVLMAIGKVEIERGDRTVQVKKDTEIISGDLISTGTTSNAQVRFNDGAVVALRPETEFRVDEYKYSGKPDGSEKASVSLLKGGVRAVTGAIGRTNRDNLKVNAVVATVGIRGTGFNITFCGAACKAANPNAVEGLYAGVFEGKVAVSNEAGATSEMGVNRFAYVKDGKTAPTLLIAPPSFLKDSLEGQVRIQPKALAINSASENSASLQNATATVKAPTTGGQTQTISADKVNQTPLQPVTSFVSTLPEKFFEVEIGDGVRPAATAPGQVLTNVLRAAEYKPAAGIGPDQKEVDLNVAVSGYTTDSYRVTAFSAGAVYSTGSGTGSAKWKDGGALDSGADYIFWGRWADGTADLGNRFGATTLGAYQGWHYVSGPAFAGPVQAGWSFSLVGGTVPTETRSEAQAGWRLVGGQLTVSSASVVSGNLDTYLARDGQYGSFRSSFSGVNFATNNGNPKAFDTSTVKVSGTTTLCTVSCAGQASLGFYGATGKYAGMTYQFTPSTYSVQGVAVFSR